MKEFKDYVDEVIKEYKRTETYFKDRAVCNPVEKVMDIAAQLYLADRIQETKIIPQQSSRSIVRR